MEEGFETDFEPHDLPDTDEANDHEKSNKDAFEKLQHNAEKINSHDRTIEEDNIKAAQARKNLELLKELGSKGLSEKEADEFKSALDDLFDSTNGILHDTPSSPQKFKEQLDNLKSIEKSIQDAMKRLQSMMDGSLKLMRDSMKKMLSETNQSSFEEFTEKLDKAYKDLNDALSKADTQEHIQEAITTHQTVIEDLMRNHADMLQEMKTVLKDKGAEKGWGDSLKDRLGSILKWLGILGGIFAALYFLAAWGSSDNGCYVYRGTGDSDQPTTDMGSQNQIGGPSGAEGPIAGSDKGKVFGFMPNVSQNSVCTNIENGIITQASCGCITTTPKFDPSSDSGGDCSKDVQVSANTTYKTWGDNCQASACKGADTNSVPPWCCPRFATSPDSQNLPPCSDAFGAKGTVAYTWYEIPPANIIANVVNGGGHMAEDTTGWFEKILKDLVKNLGPLKWIFYAFIGVGVLWLILTVLKLTGVIKSGGGKATGSSTQVVIEEGVGKEASLGGKEESLGGKEESGEVGEKKGGLTVKKMLGYFIGLLVLVGLIIGVVKLVHIIKK